MIPYDVPVTQPGSAVHQNTSSGCRSRAYGAGGVVGDHRLVHVHRALRRPGGAAGEVQQRHVLGLGRRDLVRRPAPRPSARRGRACRGSGRPSASTSSTCCEVGQRVAELGDLPPVERRGGDQHPARAQPQPLRGPARGRRRRTAGRRRWRASACPAPRRTAPVRARQREHPLAAPDAEAAQHAGEPAGLLGELGVGERWLLPSARTNRSASCAARPPAACRSTASWAMLRPRPPGSPASCAPGLVPGEGGTGRVVVHQVRPDPEAAEVFGDGGPAGGRFRSCRHGSIGTPARRRFLEDKGPAETGPAERPGAPVRRRHPDIKGAGWGSGAGQPLNWVP